MRYTPMIMYDDEMESKYVIYLLKKNLHQYNIKSRFYKVVVVIWYLPSCILGVY